MATRMTRAELHQLADAVFAAYNAHDVDALLSVLADDVTWSEPEGTWTGKGEVAVAVQAVFDGFPDSAWPKDEVVIMPGDDHSRMAVTWRWQGTQTGTYSGLPPTGRRVDVHGVTLVSVRDGVISDLQFFFDTYDYLEQLGLVPSTEGLGFKVLTTAEFTLGKVREALHV